MVDIPRHELPVIDPYVRKGVRVLEFGNKRNPSGVYRDWYEARGAEYTSVDINGKDGALKLDVRQPLNLGRFDLTTNFGFSEHVHVQQPYWANQYNATEVGGLMVGTTPQPNHWLVHGYSYWHPSKEFFEAWAALNALTIVRLDECTPGMDTKMMWRYVLERTEDTPHVWAPSLDSLIWRNPNWPIPKDGQVQW